MREVKLSPEELDRYNTKLFPPKFHYKHFPFKYRLIVDGEQWEHSVALNSGGDGRFSALLWGDAVRNVESVPISELASHFSEIQFALSEIRETPLSWAFDFLEFRCGERGPREARRTVFKIDQDFDHWSAPFSISDLSAALQAVATAHPELGYSYWQGDQNLRKGFGITANVAASESLKTILPGPNLIEFENHVEAALAPDKLVRVQFSFPAPIRNACEQYLIYFVQFLRDLGIEAGAELKEEAQHVLFTVKPKDEKQALAQIWKALEIYLQIPGLKEFAAESASFNDVAVSQLRANVSHLQGQLHLAAALLEAKNAVNAAKDAEIMLLREHFDLRQYVPESKTEPGEKEVLTPSYLEMKPLTKESSGDINLPEILRKLKRSL